MTLTPARLTWLVHLAAHGETSWGKMPGRNGSFDRHTAGLTNRTWRPMVDAGYITAEYKQRSWREEKTHWFNITDKGRAIISAGGIK